MKPLIALFSISTLGAAWQWQQVARYLSLLALGIGLAHILKDRSALARFESLLLASALLSQAWVSGFLRAGLSSKAPDRIGLSTWLSLAFLAVCALVVFRFLEETLAQNLYQQANLFAHTNERLWFQCWFFAHTTGFLLDYQWLHTKKKKALTLLSPFLHFLYPAAGWLGALSLQDDLSSLFGFMASVAIIRSCWALYLALKEPSAKSQPKNLKKLWKLAWPLCLMSLLGGYGLQIDGSIVFAALGALPFLWFQYGAREFPLSQLLANGFSESQAIAFKTNRTFEAWKPELRRMFWLCFPPSLALIAFAPSLFEMAFGPDFRPSADVFRIYLLLVIPRMLFPQTLLLAHGHNRVLMWISAVEWLLNIGLSLWWVQTFGMEGVAWATWVAFAAEKCLLFAWLRYKKPTGWELAKPNQAFWAGSFLMVLTYVLTTFL